MVYMIVAYTKALVPIKTDLYAVLVSIVVVLAAQLAVNADPTDWRVYFLAAANGFLVAATAGKMNDKAIDENAKDPP